MNDVAAWFIDDDYDEESFFVRQAYFVGDDPYEGLKRALKAEIDETAWEELTPPSPARSRGPRRAAFASKSSITSATRCRRSSRFDMSAEGQSIVFVKVMKVEPRGGYRLSVCELSFRNVTQR